MAGTPKYYVMFDKDGNAIRYEAGYFPVDISNKNVIEYSSFEEFQEVISGKLEYKGFTSEIGSVADSLAELKEQLTQADEIAIALFETQLTQEDINIQQDEAIISLYEIVGGINA